jgi:uncharacterized protein YabE (DUF348 family)
VRRRPAALALHGVILAGLVAGPMAYVAAHHTVSLSVDGSAHQVSTYASSVGQLLSEQGVTVGAHDVLAPSAGTRLTDGMEVDLLRGRPVRLVVDGVARTVWTTATTVDELTSQLGVRMADAYLSASRSTRIPLSGLSVTARLPKSVRLTVGHLRWVLVTADATWAGVLQQAGVRLGPLDIMSVAASAPVLNGQSVTVTQVTRRLVVRYLPVRFGERRVADANLYRGTTRVLVSGRVGRIRQVWRFTLHNGHQASAALLTSRLVSRPLTRVVAVGTKPRPVVVHHTSVADLNWSALARCESGGNPRAVGNGYYGLYQFSLSAWHSVGGSGSPVDASSSEQTYRAQLLYLRAGSGVWPYCGHLLFT